MSQFEQCEAGKYAYGIIDLVSRKWITSIVGPEATSTQVRVLFLKALEAEGLLTEQIRARLATLDETIADDDSDEIPLLVAISDNGTEMKSCDTRKFLAACSIAQHFGRRSTPTDQAWIETLWGHVKHEHRTLMTITDPAVLAVELERVRVHYNCVRLHEAIGYVTPNDEHEGRGDTIRAARRAGLEQADHDADAGTAATGTNHDHPKVDSPETGHHHHHQPPAGTPAMRSESQADLSRRVRHTSPSRWRPAPSTL